MTAISISIVALILSFCSFWLAYRNRIERIENQKYTRFIEAFNLLNRADVLYGQSDVSFREFWRLAKSYAALQPNDFDEIITGIVLTRNGITEKIGFLVNNKTSNQNGHSLYKSIKTTRPMFHTQQYFSDKVVGP